MNQDYIEIVEFVQHFNLSSQQLYEFYCQVLPKKKQFFKYIKGKKDKQDPSIIIVAEVFQISTREAKQYVELMDQDELNSLVSLYDDKPYTKVKIKKPKRGT